ncbi:MAG: class I SAM-dependent methyltransferase [Candidatus Omnitrophota bacterium]|nr:class I SAM-dependent methyltransferase [Candidatus Omnitrophota bacterium]
MVNNTGERILLDKESSLMIARHFCAYKFAKKYVVAKEVLDIGCGEGYGSYYLSGFASKVTGVDYDKDVVAYAKGKYPKNNLDFLVMDVNNLGSLKREFDIICSFQNIEHIRDDLALLLSINKILKKGGSFICSTCNRLDASPGKDTPSNKFHVREYLIDEFRSLLNSAFAEVEIFGLKRTGRLNFYRRLKKTGLCNILPRRINPVVKFFENVNTGDFTLDREKLDCALDFIAVCRKKC